MMNARLVTLVLSLHVRVLPPSEDGRLCAPVLPL